jgi:spermidine synthase
MEFTSWLVDQCSPDEIHMFKRSGKILAQQTQFQELQYVETETYGGVLVLDGAVQSAETDEYVYHEALVHPAMIAHPHPKSVLILGGGEGATLREVLKYPTVERAVMVDLDGELVEFCKLHLTSWHQGAFDDPRVELRHEDGRAYLENTHEQFDVIIFDITDGIPEGPAIGLYTREFHKLCCDRLTKEGVMAVQACRLTLSYWEEHAVIRETLGTAFPVVRSYITFIPSFLVTWGFLLATKGVDPLQLSADTISKRIMERGLTDKLRMYDEIAHSVMFCMPKELRANLAKPSRILEDGKPLVFA